MSLKKKCYVASISFHHLGEVDFHTNGHSRELSISSKEPAGWRGMKVGKRGYR